MSWTAVLILGSVHRGAHHVRDFVTSVDSTSAFSQDFGPGGAIG